MRCRIQWVQDGIEHEATCSGLADPHDSATAVLSRAGYIGPHVVVIIVECDDFGDHRPGEVLGMASAVSWWRLRDEEHRQALESEAKRLLSELPPSSIVRQDIEHDLAILRAPGASV